MIFSRTLFGNVAIVGVGLIGGSIGMALKKKKLAKKVIGVTTQESTLQDAIRMEAIDEGTHDVVKAIKGADLVILAAPVNTILEHLKVIAPALKRGCIITDVGSSKTEIVEKAHQVLKSSALFVGSHPMAGSEKKGAVFSSADLFEGTTCLMTPTDLTNKLAKDKVKHLWESIGATVEMMTPSDHDSALAYISHLPHLMAFGLMNTVPKEVLTHSFRSFNDITRIAGSSPKMWSDICISNQRNVLKSLDELVSQLSEFRKDLIDGDEQSLIRHFDQAKQKRSLMEKKNA